MEGSCIHISGLFLRFFAFLFRGMGEKVLAPFSLLRKTKGNKSSVTGRCYCRPPSRPSPPQTKGRLCLSPAAALQRLGPLRRPGAPPLQRRAAAAWCLPRRRAAKLFRRKWTPWLTSSSIPLLGRVADQVAGPSTPPVACTNHPQRLVRPPRVCLHGGVGRWILPANSTTPAIATYSAWTSCFHPAALGEAAAPLHLTRFA